MRTWVLVIAMLLMGVVAAAYGCLLLISPHKWRILLDHASLADRWSYPVGSRRGGADIQVRVVGLIMVGVGVFFVYTALNGVIALLLGQAAAHPITGAAGVGEPVTHSWFGLAAPAVSFLGGMFLLFFPDPLIRWGVRKMATLGEVRPKALPYVRAIIRVMGLIALLGGASAVYGWLHLNL